MPRKTRWIITLFLLLLFGGLFVLRAAWQPWLFDLITPRQDRLEGIKLVLDLLNGAGGLITILFALGMWLSGRGEKTAPASRLDEILVPTTPTNCSKRTSSRRG
jgi:hypothetical protein